MSHNISRGKAMIGLQIDNSLANNFQLSLRLKVICVLQMALSYILYCILLLHEHIIMNLHFGINKWFRFFFLRRSIVKCDLIVSCSMYLSYIMNQIELIKPVSQKVPYKCAYSPPAFFRLIFSVPLPSPSLQKVSLNLVSLAF